jgi:hypothetical protein
VQLRKQYVKKQHEFMFAMRRATEPHLVDQTPDDALRYQSVMFALIRALDKVRPCDSAPAAQSLTPSRPSPQGSQPTFWMWSPAFPAVLETLTSTLVSCLRVNKAFSGMLFTLFLVVVPNVARVSHDSGS